MSDNIQPVRKISVKENITSGGLVPPCGLIFFVEYFDNKVREIYVPTDDGCLFWNEAVFLKSGRNNNLPSEILKLKITDPNDAVPSSLIEKLKSSLEEYNNKVRLEAIKEYSQKPAP